MSHIIPVPVPTARYYLLNIVLPMFSFVVLAFSQFLLVHKDTPESMAFWTNSDLLPPAFPIDARLSVSFALVLTTITFKFTLIQLIPPIADLTLLDDYVFFCYYVIVVIAMEGAVVSSYDLVPRRHQIRVDQICGLTIGAVVVLGHILYAWWFVRARRRQLRLLGECYHVVGGIASTLKKMDQAILSAPKKLAEAGLGRIRAHHNNMNIRTGVNQLQLKNRMRSSRESISVFHFSKAQVKDNFVSTAEEGLASRLSVPPLVRVLTAAEHS